MSKNAMSRNHICCLLAVLALLLAVVGCTDDTMLPVEMTVTSESTAENETTASVEPPHTVEAVLPTETEAETVPSLSETEAQPVPLPTDRDALYRGYLDGTYNIHELFSSDKTRADARALINTALSAYRDGTDVRDVLQDLSPDSQTALPIDPIDVREPYTEHESLPILMTNGEGRTKFSVYIEDAPPPVSENYRMDLFFTVSEVDGTYALSADEIRIYRLGERLSSFRAPDVPEEPYLIVQPQWPYFLAFETADGDLALYYTEDYGDTFHACTVTVEEGLSYDRIRLLSALSSVGAGPTELLTECTLDGEVFYAVLYAMYEKLPKLTLRALEPHENGCLLPNPNVVFPNRNCPAYADSIEELSLLGLPEDDVRVRYVKAFLSGDTETLEALCGVEQGLYDGYKAIAVSRFVTYLAEDGEGTPYISLHIDAVSPEVPIFDRRLGYGEIRIIEEDGLACLDLASSYPSSPKDTDAAKVLDAQLSFGDMPFFFYVEEPLRDDRIVFAVQFFLDRSMTIPGQRMHYTMIKRSGLWTYESAEEIENVS